MAHDLAHDPDDRGSLEGSPSATGDKHLLNRRNYLRLGVLAAGTAALGSGTGAAATVYHGIRFDRTVDAVDDLNWDPTGVDPIEIPTDDGLLIEVPPGEYVFEGTGTRRGLIEGDLSNWGLRGTGDHWSDVVFRTVNGASTRFVNSGWNSDGILLENVSFDHTESRTGGDIGHTIRGRDNVEVHDVEHIGMSGAEPYCRWTMQPQITTRDGVANIVNFRKTGPSVFTGHGNSDGGGGVFSGHKGTVNFIDCRIENQGGDGGLYTGKHAGGICFRGCYFANNDMAVMRMGAGSEMHDCTLVMDWKSAHPDNVILDGEWGRRAPTGTSGVYSSSAQHGKSGGGIYDSDIIVTDTYRAGQAAIAINNSDGHMEIVNCRIRVDVPGMPGIWGRDPAHQRLSNHETPSRPWGLTIENCSITGESDDPAILLDHRHGSVVRNCCVQMAGSGPGIVLENSSDCVIEDTNVNVNGRATVFNNCTARTSNVTSADSCPRPDASWDSGDGDASERTLSIVGNGTLSEYEFTVTDELRDNPNEGPLAGLDQIDGSTASGAVKEGRDGYIVSGQVREFTLDGDATVLLDGTAVAPADLPDITALDAPALDESADEGSTDEDPSAGGSTDEPTTERVLTITGTGTRASYNFTVSDDLAHDPSRGTVDSQDSIDGASATGVVVSGTDSYLFTGSITAFTADGSVDVFLDGEQVDPATLALAHTLTVVSGSEIASTYRFTVSGGLSAAPEAEPLEVDDNISGPSAEGAVRNGTDSYRFSGTVTDFDLHGDAVVYLDGEQVSPDRLGTDEDPSLPGFVIVDGTGSSGRCEYRFTVTGDVHKSFELGSVDADDTIDDGRRLGERRNGRVPVRRRHRLLRHGRHRGRPVRGAGHQTRR